MLDDCQKNIEQEHCGIASVDLCFMRCCVEPLPRYRSLYLFLSCLVLLCWESVAFLGVRHWAQGAEAVGPVFARTGVVETDIYQLQF